LGASLIVAGSGVSTAQAPVGAGFNVNASDLRFILARTANKSVGDVLWVPGENR